MSDCIAFPDEDMLHEHSHVTDIERYGTDGEPHVHHWNQGPFELRKFRSPVIRLSHEGTEHLCTHNYRYFIDKVAGQPLKNGQRVATPSKSAVGSRLASILKSNKGWLRAGIRLYRVSDPALADCFVWVSPASDSVCRDANGNPNRFGCYWTRDGRRYVHIVIDHFYTERFVRITNHEFGHAALRAHDMYKGEGHSSYNGVMTSLYYENQVNFWPDEGDIKDASLFKQGKAVIVHPRHG